VDRSIDRGINSCLHIHSKTDGYAETQAETHIYIHIYTHISIYEYVHEVYTYTLRYVRTTSICSPTEQRGYLSAVSCLKQDVTLLRHVTPRYSVPAVATIHYSPSIERKKGNFNAHRHIYYWASFNFLLPRQLKQNSHKNGHETNLLSHIFHLTRRGSYGTAFALSGQAENRLCSVIVLINVTRLGITAEQKKETKSSDKPHKKTLLSPSCLPLVPAGEGDSNSSENSGLDNTRK
jgi:hypothetical protein